MQTITLTDTYIQVAADKTVFVGQARVKAEVYVGPAAAPTANEKGFIFLPDTPQAIPELGSLGGYVWVRGAGVFTYATD